MDYFLYLFFILFFFRMEMLPTVPIRAFGSSFAILQLLAARAIPNFHVSIVCICVALLVALVGVLESVKRISESWALVWINIGLVFWSGGLLSLSLKSIVSPILFVFYMLGFFTVIVGVLVFRDKKVSEISQIILIIPVTLSWVFSGINFGLIVGGKSTNTLIQFMLFLEWILILVAIAGCLAGILVGFAVYNRKFLVD